MLNLGQSPTIVPAKFSHYTVHNRLVPSADVYEYAPELYIGIHISSIIKFIVARDCSGHIIPL